jgi:hypothetical protein
MICLLRKCRFVAAFGFEAYLILLRVVDIKVFGMALSPTGRE